MVVFGSNKRKLHDARDKISMYLENKLGLCLKDNWQVFRFAYVKNGKHCGRALDFMGFKFYRDRTILRKTIMLKATRKAKKISKKEKPTIHDIRQIFSYIGWINCTDTYWMYEKWIKPYVNIQNCKRRLSRYDRRENKKMSINYVKSQSSEKPDLIDRTSSKSHVYLRRNISESYREDMDGNTQKYYDYEEAKLTKAEYEQYLNELAMLDIRQQRADIDYIALCVGVNIYE